MEKTPTAPSPRELLDRVRRIESKLCNLADFLGCDLVNENTRRRVDDIVTVTRGRIDTTPRVTLGELTMALMHSHFTGTFDVYVSGTFLAQVAFNPGETHAKLETLQR